MQDASELEGVVRSALAEAASMLDATKNADEDAKVTMAALQFRKLALLLRATAQMAERELDRFDKPIDGIRFWVPLRQFEAERIKLDRLRDKFEQSRFYHRAV